MTMKALLIAKREFLSYFRIPMALVVLPAFLALVGFYFYSALTNFQLLLAPRPEILQIKGANLHDLLILPFFNNVVNIFLLVVPIVTMRTVAEERKGNTWELLLTYPVRPHDILWGKYLGALAFLLLLVACTIPFQGILFWFGQPELPTLLSTYAGVILFLSFYVACGLLASLLTENQIIAALICLGISLGFLAFRWLAAISPPPFEAIFAHLLLVDHMSTFAHGIVRRSYLFLYPSMVALVMLGCFRVFSTRR